MKESRHPGSDWRTASGLFLIAAAALAFILGPKCTFAAGGEGPELFCVRGTVTLSSDGAAAREVFEALVKECGLGLRGEELIPDTTVTAEFRAVPLEDALKDIVRLSGIGSTLRATSSDRKLTLFILPEGREGGTGTGGVDAPLREEAKGEAARGKGMLPGPGGVEAGEDILQNPPPLSRRQWRSSLEALRRVDPDEAWVMERLEPEVFAAARQRAAAAEARQQFLLAATEKERLRALEALHRLDPGEAKDLAAWGPEELALLREEAAAEDRRQRFLLADDDGERRRALGDLGRLDPDEARFLGDLSGGTLEEERREAARQAALRDYLLDISAEERQKAYEETLRRDRE